MWGCKLMKWFQHSTDSHDDPDISDAMDEFGQAGYSTFFILLEIYGREFNNLDNEGFLELSLRFVARKLRQSSKKVQQILNFYLKRKRIYSEVIENRIRYCVPKYIEIASNWTKRGKTLPTEVLQSHDSATTAKEKEEEKEEKKNIKEVVSSFELPDKETVNESSIPQVKMFINQISDKLYYEKIWVEAPKYTNTMLKRAKNPRAVLHTLIRVYIKKPKQDQIWGYCQQILKTEDGNYNERDFRKTQIPNN